MDRSELIDLHLRGQLTEQQSLDFDNLLQTDLEFVKEVQQRTELVDLLKKQKTIELKEQLNQAKENYKKGKSNSIPYKGIVVFLGALLLSYFAYQYITSISNSAPDSRMIASTFEVYPMSLADRGSANESDMIKLEKLYAEGDYAASIPILEDIIRSVEYDGKWHLFLSSALAKTEHYDAALIQLQIIVDKNDLLYLDEALRFQALFQRLSSK